MNDRLLYVGKAKCLRERVGSYFGETSFASSSQTAPFAGRSQAHEYEECGSELEALLVERRLIAELLPVLKPTAQAFRGLSISATFQRSFSAPDL
jgi:excinuclease UvrABC nuclease subunit